MSQLISKSCILLHGAWYGGWAWSPIINSIKKTGYYKKIIAPDLPGHNSIKLDFKDITLETYTNHVLNLMELLPVPVTLVGHSMSGLIISSVAEQAPSKVDCLVYVAGFIPDNGGTLIDEEKKAKYPSVALAVTVDERNCTIKIAREKAKDLFYNCSDVKYVNDALTNIQEQPLLPFLSPVILSEKNFGCVKKFYIKCLKDQAIHPIDQERMYSKINCTVFTLDSDHSPFFSSQDELITLLGHCTQNE